MEGSRESAWAVKNPTGKEKEDKFAAALHAHVSASALAFASSGVTIF
jgi:hypothetical protein